VSARRRVYEWVAPEEPFPEDDHAKAVSYLDRQARFDLAVWVGYRFRADGRADHELKLRVGGRRPGRRELSALFWGVSYELSVAAYIGIPTRAEMDEARRVGEIVWERTGPPPAEADPLDFRSTSEQITVSPALRQAIREAMEAFPVVRYVGVRRSKLWKSGEIFQDGINFGVLRDDPTAPPAGLGRGPVGAISDLLEGPLGDHLRELMSGPRTGLGVSMGTYPPGDRPVMVYERTTVASTDEP
jgi:hypothetical protein